MGKPMTSLDDLEIDPLPSPKATSSPRRQPPQYIDLDLLRDPDGIVAIISQRLSNRNVTFAIFKEFEREGRVERTSFIAASLRAAFNKMVDLVWERIDEIQGDAAKMRKIQEAALEKFDPADQEHIRRVLGFDRRGGRR